MTAARKPTPATAQVAAVPSLSLADLWQRYQALSAQADRYEALEASSTAEPCNVGSRRLEPALSLDEAATLRDLALYQTPATMADVVAGIRFLQVQIERAVDGYAEFNHDRTAASGDTPVGYLSQLFAERIAEAAERLSEQQNRRAAA